MSGVTLTTVLLAGAVAIVLALLGAAFLLLRGQLQALGEQHAQLQEKFSALQLQQQQQQNELLAMGQRIIESEKLVRRFHERIDAIENAGPTRTQYGQLETLLAKSIGEQTETSAAESELLMLLRQQQRRS